MKKNYFNEDEKKEKMGHNTSGTNRKQVTR